MLTSDDLVTGEAVALDLPPAGLAIRIASGLIDLVVALVLLIVLALIFGIATTNVDGAIATIAVISVTVLVFVAFPATIETLTRGRSLGKLATDDALYVNANRAAETARSLLRRGQVELWPDASHAINGEFPERISATAAAFWGRVDD